MSAVSKSSYISFDQFSQYDFRVAEVTKSEYVGPSDQLKIELSYGHNSVEEVRIFNAGKSPDSLVGRKILTIKNAPHSSSAVTPLIFPGINGDPAFFETDSKRPVASDSTISIGNLGKRKDVVTESDLGHLSLKVARVRSQIKPINDDAIYLNLEFEGGVNRSATLPYADLSLELEGKKILTFANLRPECHSDCSVVVISYKCQKLFVPFILTSDVLAGTQFSATCPFLREEGDGRAKL